MDDPGVTMGAGDPKGATPLRPGRKCPICGRASIFDAYPFCSPRCSDVDLGRWLSGAYAIPAHDEQEAGERPSPAPATEDEE